MRTFSYKTLLKNLAFQGWNELVKVWKSDSKQNVYIIYCKINNYTKMSVISCLAIFRANQPKFVNRIDIRIFIMS